MLCLTNAIKLKLGYSSVFRRVYTFLDMLYFLIAIVNHHILTLGCPLLGLRYNIILKESEEINEENSTEEGV